MIPGMTEQFIGTVNLVKIEMRFLPDCDELKIF